MSAQPEEPVDYGHTKHAEDNRRRKAIEIAKVLRLDDCPPDVAEAYDVKERRTVLKAAEVDRASDETWAMAVGFLRQRLDWEAREAAKHAHPDHQEPQAPAQAPTDVLPVPEDAPPGWEALCALPLLTRPDARCLRCGRQAIVGTLTGWRCPGHPPVAGEWGARLRWERSPHRQCAPNRCVCGRCDGYTIPGDAPLPQAAGQSFRRSAQRTDPAPIGQKSAATGAFRAARDSMRP